MSLFQSTVAVLYGFSLFSWVLSHTVSEPSEDTAVTKDMKEKDFYHILLSALLKQVNMEDIEGGQKNARMKKNPVSEPSEDTAVREDVKENDFYHILLSALLERVNMDDIEEGLKNARMKKSPAGHAKAAQMPASKLLNLLYLTFRHLFSFSSKKKIDGEMPIKPSDTARTILQMINTRIARLKGKEQKRF